MTEMEQRAIYDKSDLSLLNDDRFGEIIISAVRYALGRSTNIVSITAEYVEACLPYLGDRAMQVVINDIDRHDKIGCLGDAINKYCWLHLRHKITQQIEMNNSK